MLELTTLGLVKTLLKNPDPNLDTLIDGLIKSYSLAASEYCLREFDKGEETEFFDGGTSSIFLSRKPVIEVLGVWVDDDWLWNEEDRIPVNHYRLINSKNGIVSYKYGLWYPSNSPKGVIKVIYEGGFDIAPDDLEMAIRTQVAYKVKRREDLGLTSVAFPDGAIQKRIIDEFLPEVKNVLDRYTPTYVG